MLEIASDALVASTLTGIAAFLPQSIARGVRELTCFLCNLHGHSGIPGSGPGLGGPFAGRGGEDDEPDRCAAEKRDVLAADGNLDMVQQQINALKAQIQALAAPMQDLLNTMSSLADACREEVLWYLLDGLLDKAKDILLEGIGADEIVDAVTDPTGAGAYASFFGDMKNYFTLLGGSWEQLGDLAREEGMTAIQQYVGAMMQLRQLIDKGYELRNNINHKQEDLPELQRKADEAHAALDACMAAAG
jgi:hypothetical protein